MRVPEDRSLRVITLLLLVAGLVSAMFIPGLTPTLTDPVQGDTEGDPTPEAASYDSPERAAALTGLSSSPQRSLSYVAAQRDAPAPPPLPEVEGEDPLPDAIRTLATSGTPDEQVPLDDPALQTRLDRAARLPQGLQEEIALVVLATAQARDLQAEAVEDLSPAERQALASGDLPAHQAREIRSKVDMGKSLQAAQLVDAAVREAEPGLKAWSEVAASPSAQENGLLTPAQPPEPGQQAGDIVGATGTPRNGTDMIRSAAALQGLETTPPPMPDALEDATLQELIVSAYVNMGLPRSGPAVTSVAAAPALHPDVRETAAVGLRHYLHALVLQEQAMADLTPAERQALSAAAPHLVQGDVDPTALARAGLSLDTILLAAQAVDDIDREKALQSAAALAQASSALERQGEEVPDTPNAPVNVDCPRDARNPDEITAAGISPVRTDRPVTCTVGDLTVRLGLNDDSSIRLTVDTNGDGEPDEGVENLGRSLQTRLHWNPDTLQVTVYTDDGDNEVEEDEIEFQNEPLRDRDNNVAFTDPYGFFVVGAEGPTTFDDRYGQVNVPPAPRGERVDSLRNDVESNAPVGPDNARIPIVVTDDAQIHVDRTDDTLWRTLKAPVNVTVNPNGTHALTVDLDGDSRYDRNIAGPITSNLLYEDDRDEEIVVAGFRTGITNVPSPVGPFPPLFPGAAVDLGGDDEYRSTLDRPFLGHNFTTGAGYLGTPGVLVDHGGDDRYVAGNFSIGYGNLGSTALVADLGGDDRFEAGDLSIGNGGLGTGLVLSRGGNDTYVGGDFTQGVGFGGQATGLLADVGPGDDTYITRMASETNTIFVGSQFPQVAQGGSTQGGTGMLLDEAGDDTYLQPNLDDPDQQGGPDHTRGVSFSVTGGLADIVGANTPSLLVDLEGDDDGIPRTSTIDHSRLGTIGLRPHFSGQPGFGGNTPTGYAIDAAIDGGPEDLKGEGYIFSPGDVTWDTQRDPVTESNFTFTVPGLLAVGDGGSTTWTESYVVSLDLGGDDTYENRPGGAVIVPETTPGTGDDTTLVGGDQYRPRLASVHVDLAGSDRYELESVRDSPSHRGLGYGLGAVGLAYDLTDDPASAPVRADACQGDRVPGADCYVADTEALGHGRLGVGLFVDQGGPDTYRVTDGDRAEALGYGDLGGVGLFVDVRGHDTYHAGDAAMGAYDMTLERSAANQGIGHTIDNADAEVGAGLFLDRRGADVYNVTERSLGRVVADQGALNDVQGEDGRPVAALFVDDGFGLDAYPEVHTDEGRGNNTFWNVTPLGRGFDNLDYYTHHQVAWNGDETARRAVSLLLSPSARITDPAYPNASAESGIETFQGAENVTVNVSYGGNRSLLLNARSLAIAPLEDLPRGVSDATPDLVDLPVDEDDVEENASAIANGTDVDNLRSFTKFGIRYTHETYYALQFAMKSEQRRGESNEGVDDSQYPPPDSYLDSTEEGYDRTLALVGQDDSDDNTVNSKSNKAVIKVTSRAAYNTLDGLTFGADPTLITDTQIVRRLEGDLPIVDRSPNDVVDSVFACAQGTADKMRVLPDADLPGGCNAPAQGRSAGSQARSGETLRWATAQHLLLVKAMASGVPGGASVDAPVDDALARLGAPQADLDPDPPADRVAGDRDEAPVSAADREARECPGPGGETTRRAAIACTVREAFHEAVDQAASCPDAAARNGTEEACEDLAVVNPPQGGQFVREVEVVADGKPVASKTAASEGYDTRYNFTWNTAELTDDDRYRWEDGLHDLTAHAYYRPAGGAEDRPNRCPHGSTGCDSAETGPRTSDPYGFYPGTDRVKVRTDNPPMVYTAKASDFNPEPELYDRAGDCGSSDGTLTCKLTYNATLSEDPEADGFTVEATVVDDDGSVVHEFDPEAVATDDEAQTVEIVESDSAQWETTDPADGRYHVRLTLDDGTYDPTEDDTPFYITRRPPATLATPLANDRGISGIDHVEIQRNDDGTVDRSAETPWSLPVTAVLSPDEPDERSPVESFTLYRRVYDPSVPETSDEFVPPDPDTSCPGETVTKDGATWCKVAEDVPGNRTLMNITTLADGTWSPENKISLDGRQVYLVALGTDRAGNREADLDGTRFPEVGPDLGTGDPEGETLVDLSRPTSTLDVDATPRNETRVVIPYETQGGPIQDVEVIWALAGPDESVSPEDGQTLPDSLVDEASQHVVWTPEAGEEPEDGDRLLLLMRATDAAGNTERISEFSVAIPFDFQGPAIDGEVQVERRAGSLTVDWTTVEPLADASVRYWPEGEPNETEVADVAGSPFQHRAVLDGLDSSTAYTVELRMRDRAGNLAVLDLDDAVRTRRIVDIQPLGPEDGDVLTGEAEVTWIARNITGDPSIDYNLTLAADGGDCSIPLAERTIFESEPSERSIAVDTTNLPDLDGAHLCLAANNTRNPDNPVVQRFPPGNGTLAVDNTPPTTNLTVGGPGDGEWKRGEAVVVLDATDGTDTPLTTWYTLDGSEPTEYTGPFSIREDGVHTLTYWTEDDALGHVEEKRTAEVAVDGTRPDGEITVDEDASRTGSRNVTVTINATDETSGLSDVVLSSPAGHQRRVPGALLAGGSVEVPWTLSPGDGRKQVQAALIDEAGNRVPVRDTITLDTSPPRFTTLASRGVGFTQAALDWSTDEPATAEVLYKEQGSPAFSGRVVVDDAQVQHTVVLENLTPATTYVVKVAAQDRLGNEFARALTFTTEVDETPPGPVENVEATVLDSGFVELEWDEAFDEVGVANYVVGRSEGDAYVKVAETPRTVYLDDEAPPGETLKYKVQAVDVGGNGGPPSEAVEVTTTTAPEVLDGRVTPERGTPADTYTFTATVRDRDGDTPESVLVIIDGEPREMTPSGSGDITSGVTYHLETTMDATTLSQGTHTYAFEVSDGTDTVRWPDDGSRSGPVVIDAGDDDTEVAGFGAVRRAVPAAGPALVLAGLAAAAAALRRPTP